jgi:hypothetical protein
MRLGLKWHHLESWEDKLPFTPALSPEEAMENVSQLMP